MDAVFKQSAPSSLGYRMPAEWAPHDATWLSWPSNQETWPTQIERVRHAWTQTICALSPHERVNLLVADDAAQQDVRGRLREAGADLGNVSFFKIPTVDVWMRDYGPTFVLRNAERYPLAMNDWIFNGWGGKYPAYEDDDRVAKILAAILNVPVFDHPIVLEGGSIEVNGEGACLTTEQCLLNPNRNPGMSRAEIEEFLKRSLGVTHVIWLGEGIVGDDTDGHIDDIARFVDAKTVVCVLEPSSQDDNHRPLWENYERLQAAADQSGGRWNLVALPSPRPVAHEGVRLPASYANFYIANGVVLVPTFDDPADREALGVLQELFPSRKIIGIPCRDVVAGLGTIHCVTQQQPRVFLSRA